MLYNPNIDLVNVNVYTKFVKFCALILKLHGLSKPRILTSIKGRNSVLNLRKMTLYCDNPNVDIVNDNVYTRFGQDDIYPAKSQKL